MKHIIERQELVSHLQYIWKTNPEFHSHVLSNFEIFGVLCLSLSNFEDKIMAQEIIFNSLGNSETRFLSIIVYSG